MQEITTLRSGLERVYTNTVNSSPFILICAGFLASIVSGDSIGAKFSITALIFGVLMNYFEKHIASIVGENYESWKRPNPPEEGCGCFSDSILKKETFGMPSGHAQIAGFALAFWIFYMSDQKGNKRYASLTCMIAIFLTICYSRIKNGCHNLLQVAVGGSVGFIFGKIVYDYVR